MKLDLLMVADFFMTPTAELADVVLPAAAWPEIDEVVGMLITLAFIPVGWSAALAGFVLFRIFNVIKPFPAGRLESLHGGFGVMADDAMAAFYANVSLRLLMWLLPAWIS